MSTTTPTMADLCRGLDRLPPIFASCLAVDHSRCQSVFEVDGFVYATSGYLVVRVPTPEGWDVPNPDRPILSVGSAFTAEYEPDPVALPEVEVRNCSYCGGTRFRDVTPCPSCEGGQVDAGDCECPHCDGTHDCDKCDGKGSLPAGPCRHCMRSGVEGSQDEGAEVAPGVWISRRSLALLVRFGAKAYLPAHRGPGWGRGDPAEATDAIRFVAGDVEGRLMPMDARRAEYDRDKAGTTANHIRGEC